MALISHLCKKKSKCENEEYSTLIGYLIDIYQA